MDSPENPFAAPASGAAALTPEPVKDSLATRGSRLAASIVDVVILGGIFVPIVLITAATSSQSSSLMPLMVQIGVTILCFLCLFTINGWFLHTRGQTLGKMALKIRIVRVDGHSTNGWDTIGKRVVPIWALQMIPVVGSVVGLINILFIFRQDRRCLHDLIAGTEVISLKSASGR